MSAGWEDLGISKTASNAVVACPHQQGSLALGFSNTLFHWRTRLLAVVAFLPLLDHNAGQSASQKRVFNNTRKYTIMGRTTEQHQRHVKCSLRHGSGGDASVSYWCAKDCSNLMWNAGLDWCLPFYPGHSTSSSSFWFSSARRHTHLCQSREITVVPLLQPPIRVFLFSWLKMQCYNAKSWETSIVKDSTNTESEVLNDFGCWCI